MTEIEGYAQHGSTSYGKITPRRFSEILRGDRPSGDEKACICQALTETPESAISGEHADKLAAELGMTRVQVEARCWALCGCAMGANAFPEILPEPPNR